MHQAINADAPDVAEARHIEHIPVAEEMNDSFLAYALSVITSRAIPDVRDGLKPVQRRVLWSMMKMGVRPGTSYRKSARIVGDTMGRFHPHGDMAIYETLVRMGQDFSLLAPMIEPQGNFGSLDDPPAASRYTECRLTDAAMTMLQESDENTVDFRPTYDGEDIEPAVLPGAFPNLLVNGTAGIAVGMATKMWPHNLREVAACINLVMDAQPKTGKRRAKGPTVDEMMAVLSGPDFPTGGIVIAGDELREAYKTGRGAVTIRARVHVEPLTRTRHSIIATELPYQIGPETVVARISKLISEDKLEGVSGVSDLSDVSGVKLRIELKPTVSPDAVIEDLYTKTSLETTFKANNVVLVDGVPSTLGLRELCEYYIRHRLEVIVRRTEYRIEKAEARLHIVEGLLTALSNIDAVVALIRKSRSTETARTNLMKTFKMSEIQANHVLEMPLRRLTSLERTKLIEEKKALTKAISQFRAILASEGRQRKIVSEELGAIVEAHGVDRQADITATGDADSTSLLSASTEATGGLGLNFGSSCLITLSSSGKLGLENAETGRRTTFGRHDLLLRHARGTGDGVVVAVTATGRTQRIPIAEIPQASNRVRGDDARKVLGIKANDKVASLVTTPGLMLVLITKKGTVKRIETTPLLAASSGTPVIKLDRNDRVATAFVVKDDQAFCVVTSDGYVTRIPSGDVGKRSLATAGVAGMSVRPGATVVAANAAGDDDVITVATDQKGYSTIAVDDIPMRGRGSKGVKLVSLKPGEKIMSAVVGPPRGLAIQYVSEERPDGIDTKPQQLDVEPRPRAGALLRSDRGIHLIAQGRVL